MDSISTLTSIAGYNDETYAEVVKLFVEFEAKNGPTKSFPVNVSQIPFIL